MIKPIALACLVIAFSVTGFAQSTKETADNSASLQLSVSTNQQIYRLSDELKMKVELSNVSEKDIYVWASDLCWNPAKGLSMQITSADGSPATGNVLLDCVPPPPRSGGLNTLIRIQPGQSYSRTDTFKVRDLINMPGEFDIRITFRSFLSRQFINEFLAKEPIASLPVWTMEKPTLAAPKIHVVITE